MILPLLLSVFACEKPGRHAPTAEDKSWTKKRTLDAGPSVYARKEPGHRAYLVYVPLGSSGVKELREIDEQILAAGWDILTMNVDGNTETISDAAVVEFLRYGLDTPGLTGRIAAVPGRRLSPAFEGMKDSLPTLSGLIVLKPGDAPFYEPALAKAVRALPKTLPILWIHSGYLPESAVAEQYANILKVPAFGRMASTGLALMKVDGNLPKQLADDTFINFLGLVRRPIEWKKAESVFVNGCTPDGYWKIPLGGYFASSPREADFCPLFLKSPDGRLLRAHEVTEYGCQYTLGGVFRNLRCKY